MYEVIFHSGVIGFLIWRCGNGGYYHRICRSDWNWELNDWTNLEDI